MREFFSSVKFKIILGILAVCIGMLIYSSTHTESSGAKTAVGGFFEPLQKLSTAISDKVASTLDMLVNAKDYYEENEKLKDQIAGLTAELVDKNTVYEENIHLREMAGLKAEYEDYEFSPPCAVIGREANDIYKSFTIDKGYNDGISVRDPVVTAYGMVGIISSVEATHSTVTTIFSHEMNLGVYCSRTRDTGIISGHYELAAKGLMLMRFVDYDSDIRPGDIIVTSGHSGLVPQDRVVGVVKSVEDDSLGLSKNVYVEPSVDIGSVKNVFVIIEFEGQGDGYEE